MSELINRIFVSLRREDGQATAEYALVLGLVVVGAIALLATLGTDIKGILKALTDQI